MNETWTMPLKTHTAEREVDKQLQKLHDMWSNGPRIGVITTIFSKELLGLYCRYTINITNA